MSKPNAEEIPGRATRQQQAGIETRRETRRLVLVAAADEFAERGYRGATVERIAKRANVAVPTLYAAWRSKQALLRAVMSQAVTGRDDGFETGPDPAELLNGPVPGPTVDPTEFITQVAASYRAIAERSAVGWRTYRDAAAVDPKIDTDWTHIQANRRATFRAVLTYAPADSWRTGLSLDDVIDTIWAIASPETHELFVQRRGWDYDRYQYWVASTLIAALLPPSTQTDPT